MWWNMIISYPWNPFNYMQQNYSTFHIITVHFSVFLESMLLNISLFRKWQITVVGVIIFPTIKHITKQTWMYMINCVYFRVCHTSLSCYHHHWCFSVWNKVNLKINPLERGRVNNYNITYNCVVGHWRRRRFQFSIQKIVAGKDELFI